MLRKEINYELYLDYILIEEYRKIFPSTRAIHTCITLMKFLSRNVIYLIVISIFRVVLHLKCEWISNVWTKNNEWSLALLYSNN